MATVVVEEGAVEAAGSWKTMHTVEFSGEYYGHEEHPALPEANQLDHATRESIKAMAGLIAVLQQREQSLEDLVRQQLQLLQSAVNNADQRVNRVVENALPG